jgi:hypothetical protein
MTTSNSNDSLETRIAQHLGPHGRIEPLASVLASGHLVTITVGGVDALQLEILHNGRFFVRDDGPTLSLLDRFTAYGRAARLVAHLCLREAGPASLEAHFVTSDGGPPAVLEDLGAAREFMPAIQALPPGGRHVVDAWNHLTVMRTF